LSYGRLESCNNKEIGSLLSWQDGIDVQSIKDHALSEEKTSLGRGDRKRGSVTNEAEPSAHFARPNE
jgi:hypothetical protein